MKDWNIIVTTLPQPGSESHVLHALRRFGTFGHAGFKDVCIGRVENQAELLEDVMLARARNEAWATEIARILPVEKVFHFDPASLGDLLKAATQGFPDRMTSGKFHVRLERRGMAGKIFSPDIEKAVADHLYDVAQRQNKVLHTDFADPDFIVLAETLGDQCGVALLPRTLLRKYPFVQPR